MFNFFQYNKSPIVKELEEQVRILALENKIAELTKQKNRSTKEANIEYKKTITTPSL